MLFRRRVRSSFSPYDMLSIGLPGAARPAVSVDAVLVSHAGAVIKRLELRIHFDRATVDVVMHNVYHQSHTEILGEDLPLHEALSLAGALLVARTSGTWLWDAPTAAVRPECLGEQLRARVA